jgi:4-hydroxy-2-oxoheptanedioate aldolase
VARASRWGRITDYAERADDEVGVWVQAESRAALSELEAICAVEGVDCVFIGPADLAADMGLGGDDPALLEAMEDVVRRIRAAGTAAGLYCAPHLIPRFEAAGANVITLGADAAVLVSGLDALR